MENINRIKVVLVEKKKTGKWLAEQLSKAPSTVSKWCSNASQLESKRRKEKQFNRQMELSAEIKKLKVQL